MGTTAAALFAAAVDPDGRLCPSSPNTIGRWFVKFTGHRPQSKECMASQFDDQLKQSISQSLNYQ